MSGNWLFTVIFFIPKYLIKLNCVVIILFVECFKLWLGNTDPRDVYHGVSSWLWRNLSPGSHWWWLPPQMLCILPTFRAIECLQHLIALVGCFSGPKTALLPFLFTCLQRMCPTGSRGQGRNAYTRVCTEGLDQTHLEVQQSWGELQELTRDWKSKGIDSNLVN